jgi:hypothetical protein
MERIIEFVDLNIKLNILQKVRWIDILKMCSSVES